jgi:hypothetical protein
VDIVHRLAESQELELSTLSKNPGKEEKA